MRAYYSSLLPSPYVGPVHDYKSVLSLLGLDVSSLQGTMALQQAENTVFIDHLLMPMKEQISAALEQYMPNEMLLDSLPVMVVEPGAAHFTSHTPPVSTAQALWQPLESSVWSFKSDTAAEKAFDILKKSAISEWNSYKWVQYQSAPDEFTIDFEDFPWT